MRRAFLAALLRLTVNCVVPAPADLVEAPTLIWLAALAAQRGRLRQQFDRHARSRAGDRDRALDRLTALALGDDGPAGCRARRGRRRCERFAAARGGSRGRLRCGRRVGGRGRRGGARRRRPGGRRGRGGGGGRRGGRRGRGRGGRRGRGGGGRRRRGGGCRVAVAVAVAVAVVVGVGVAPPSTITVPVMNGCWPQTNAYVPAALNRHEPVHGAPVGSVGSGAGPGEPAAQRARRRLRRLELDVVEVAAVRRR